VEGIRRIDAWSRITRAIGGKDARYERAADFEAALAVMSLGPELRAIVETLTQPRTVGEICAGSTLPDFEVCRAIWAFRVLGILRRTDTAKRTAAESTASVFSLEDDGLGDVLSAGD
jgi:hypothetical protein